MTRIYPPFAYSSGPRTGCWWDETIASPNWPVLNGSVQADVAIVGGGFTGLSAALHLAEAGVSVAVLEAETPGWGASGRNGGFCCLGGSKLDDAGFAKAFGRAAADEFWQAERDAVQLVSDTLDRFGIDVDRHSHGDTCLAHNGRRMNQMRAEAEKAAARPGPAPEVIEKADLAAQGMTGPFHGAVTTRVGFGLNPRKYLFGLAAAAQDVGAQLFQNSAVTGISSTASGYELRTRQGTVRANSVIIATNGYSSEDTPDWLAGRYMPTQSTVLVTRPMTQAELDAQGWTTDQMAYDSRNMLHYFRLMPDRRFLFGMRGGLISSSWSEAHARRRTRADFEQMFPAWAGVGSDHSWSGMVCLSRNRVPYAGPVPGKPGMFAGLAYHGNGVAMGSYTGHLLAGLVLKSKDFPPVPQAMQRPMTRFPLGRARRLLMPRSAFG